MKKIIIGLTLFSSLSVFADETIQISKKTGVSIVTSAKCYSTNEGVKLIVITCDQHSQYKANAHVVEDGKLVLTQLEAPRTVFVKSKSTKFFPNEPGSSQQCGVTAEGFLMEAGRDRQGMLMSSPSTYKKMEAACGGSL